MVASGADGEKMPVMSSARTRILAQRIETVMNQINSFAATALTWSVGTVILILRGKNNRSQPIKKFFLFFSYHFAPN